MKTAQLSSAFSILALALIALVPAARAQETPAPTQPPAAADANKPADHRDAAKDADKDAAIPPEKTVPTHHELAIGGKTLKYTATAGTLLIREQDDKPYGSMFYVAYTLDGAEPGTRPVSFLYNGGPGAATIWLHMGSFSPVRVSTDSPNPTSGPPFKLVPNQYSLLDKTDLVFVDAPLTGFSRAVGKGQPKDLIGTDPDLRAFDRFIIRYLTVNQRWNSPKFLIGESYGTTRSAALADMLGNDGVQLNGVVLISSILNYSIRAGGYDIHLHRQPAQLRCRSLVLRQDPQQARECSRLGAAGPRVRLRPLRPGAFCRRQRCPPRNWTTMAKQVSHFTGLSVDYIKEANLRISPFRFRKEVLRDRPQDARPLRHALRGRRRGRRRRNSQLRRLRHRHHRRLCGSLPRLP